MDNPEALRRGLIGPLVVDVRFHILTTISANPQAVEIRFH